MTTSVKLCTSWVIVHVFPIGGQPKVFLGLAKVYFESCRLEIRPHQIDYNFYKQVNVNNKCLPRWKGKTKIKYKAH